MSHKHGMHQRSALPYSLKFCLCISVVFQILVLLNAFRSGGQGFEDYINAPEVSAVLFAYHFVLAFLSFSVFFVLEH
jgi:hypothetical protein